MSANDVDADLVTLDVAVQPYRGLTIRMLRRLIAIGRLPASKVGRGYLVAPNDVASLLRPTLRAPEPRLTREGPTARAERQLREAGIG